MPIYDYSCAECSVYFTELRPMARSAEPAECPACGASAQRMIAAPRLNTMRADVRKAHQTNERSAHQPKVSGHRCSSSCSHGSAAGTGALKQPSGVKRPWMLGH
jgi:putative FmdB family regulatory protein